MNFLVKVYPWENARLYGSEEQLRCGEKVVVVCEHFNELGLIEKECSNCEAKEQVSRKASESDLKQYEKNETDKIDYIEFCKSEVKKLALEMKIVDCGVSLDGKQIIFVFTSDGRVDFRELVRSLCEIQEDCQDAADRFT